MNMTTVVRTCMLVVVLVVLGTTSVFGQIVYNVGAPNGTPFNGTGLYNFAVNREGNSELFPAVTVCANTSGSNPGVPAPGAAAAFDTGDIYAITFAGSAGNSPILKTLGTLGGANLQVSQAAAGSAAVFTGTAAMVQPPVVGPAFAVLPAVATVTLTVTTGPTGAAGAGASGVNCVSVQGLRFDIGNTATGTVAGPPAQGTTYGATVTQTLEGNAPLVPITGAVALGNPGNPGLATGMPLAAGIGVTATAGFATVRSTLGTVGLTGFANPTGYTTGNTAISTTTAGINVGGAAASNPASQAAGGIAATIVQVTQGSGGSSSGTISVQQNPVAIIPGVGSPVTPVVAGGGLFRGFVASGPDVTTLLNTTGATTGTQVQIAVSRIPTGATVTFPATVSTSSGLAVWNMSGGGTLSTPGGTITYSTTINEGTALSLDGVTAGLGVNIDIPFTVTAAVGGSSGVAQVIVNVGPTTAQGGVPSYSQVNGLSVIPSQVLTNVGQWALFRIAPNTSTLTYPYVIVFGAAGQPSSYDTGIVVENSGKGTTGTNSGQDGSFTVYCIGSTVSATGTVGAPAVVSIASTAAGIPNPGHLSSTGNLVQGGIWQALASEILKAAGVTSDWRGYVIVSNNFPNTRGFAFISQFANPGGGATMGYIAQ